MSYRLWTALKLFFVCSLAVGLLFAINFRYLKDAELKIEKEQLLQRTQDIGKSIEDEFFQYQRILNSLRNSPSVEFLINHYQNTKSLPPLDSDLAENSVQSAEFNLAKLFQGFAEADESILQLRFIGATNKGLELVRVNKVDGISVIAPKNALQEKGQFAYVQKTQQLKQGEFYCDQINLNRENGSISKPETPVIRIGIPVYGDEKQAFGVLVINLDWKALIEKILNQSGHVDKNPTWVVNREFGILYSPTGENNFSFEHGDTDDFSSENRLVYDYLSSNPFETDSETRQYCQIKPANGKFEGFCIQKVFKDSSEDNFFYVIKQFNDQELVASFQNLKTSTLKASSVLLLMGFIVSLVSSQIIVKPVQDLVGAIKSYQIGSSVHLKKIWIKEFSELAQSFELLTQQIAAAEEKLSQEAIEKVKIQEAADARSTFLASMSHEIRTPLNGIIGTCQLIQTTNLDEEQKSYLDTTFKSAKLLLSLVNDILDFSKLESSKLTLNRSSFDLEDLIKDSINLVKPMANEKKIDLKFAIKNPPAQVIGDAVRVQQILVNIIGNAVKFTSEGWVNVFLNWSPVDEKHIDIKVVVEDTGIGIEEDKLDKVFDRFTQLKEETTRKYQGSGLGLSIVKKLLDLMDGDIQVQSKLGEGTRFTVTLKMELSPITKKAPTLKNKSLEINADGMPVRSSKLLVAEDNRVNAKILQGMLTKLGFSHVIVSNGQEVLDELERNPDYDLVLMDCGMPLVDGYEATRKIRASASGYSSIPVYAFTASVLGTDVQRCYDAGMNFHISKPVMLEELSKILDKFENELSSEISV